MIVANNFGFGYDELLVKNVNFKVKPSSVVAVLSKNGLGKTTFFYSILGLIPKFIDGKVVGDLSVFNKKPNEFKNKFIVFQDVRDVFVKPVVKEELLFNAKDKDFALAIARTLGLRKKLNRKITSLSYGEMHKLALASAFSSKARLLIFDETFSGLDFPSLIFSMRMLRKYKQDRIIFFSTHNTKLAFLYSDQVFIIHRKRILIGKHLLKRANSYGLMPLNF